MLFLFGLLGATAIGGVAYVIAQVPLPKEAPLAQTTVLTDASGAQLAVIHGAENRFPVKLAQVPKVLQDAVISAEDRKFFEHSGVDPLGIARATWADLRHHSRVQGGSSITQQYVKNVYVGRQRTFMRKIKEAIIAIKLERKYSKRQILERYLNTIYFGRGAYGVEAAAKTWFGKDAGQLGLPEASYLAGLIRGPETADVARNPDGARRERSRVLSAMVQTRAITASQRNEVENIDIANYVAKPSQREATVANASVGTQYFVDYVRRQLVAKYGEDFVLRGGLRVQTTLDPKLQTQAYNAVYGSAYGVLWDKKNDPAGALVSLDSQGHVLAMVGGRDWETSKVNLAVGRGGGGLGRQGGSAFKPFVLAEMVHEGYTVESSFPGPAKIVLPHADGGRDWTVQNFDNEGFGRLNLIDATRHSVNTIYAQLVTALGPEKIPPMAHALGIKSKLDPVPSITLGTQNVSPLDMADAYLSFANEGVQTDPQVVSKITDAGGTVIYDGKVAHNRVLSKDQANVVNFALRQVVQHGTGTGADFGKPMAGKTGTTEDFGDAWFVGYTPKISTAVWMGYEQGQSRQMTDVHGVHNVNGGSLPASIFQRFMARATKDSRYDGGDFATPSSFPGKVLGARVPFVEPASPSDTTPSTAPKPKASTSVPTSAAPTTTRVTPTAPTLPSTTAPSPPSTPATEPPTTRPRPPPRTVP